MEKVPAISVIVPVYKVERYVEAAIRSVLAQTFKDFELIIVDDCSPDGSFEICQKLAREDDRIKIVCHEINRGLGPTRNTGQRLARGKYVFFLDSDDLLVPNALEIMHRAAEENDAEVVHCSNFIERTELEPGVFDPKQTTIGDKVQINGMLYADRSKRLVERYIGFNEWMMVWLNLYRRDFLERHRLFNPSMKSEDDPFTIALHCLTERYYCIPNALYIYTRRKGSIMGNFSRENVGDWIRAVAEGVRCIDEIMSRLPESVLPTETKNRVLGLHMARFVGKLFKFFDAKTIRSADAEQIFRRAMQSAFDENSNVAAIFLHNYAFQLFWSKKMLPTRVPPRKNCSVSTRSSSP